MYECPTTQPMSEAVNIVSPAPSPYTAPMLHLSATAWPPLSCTSGSVASTGTQSTGAAPVIASAQSRSRPRTSAAFSCGRCRITQRSGLWAEISIA